MWKSALLLLVLAFMAAQELLAQQLEMVVREGFVPDPRTISVRAGGDRSMDECGYGYDSPDNWVAIDYVGSGSSDLYFYVEGDTDTMLLVLTGDGKENHCDDDSYGSLNPLVHFPRAEPGVYGIWVGSYVSGVVSDVTLHISSRHPGTFSDDVGTSTEAGRPDLSLEPTYGRVTLAAGFTPEPHTLSLSAGGSVDVELPGCSYGYVARAPDYNVTYSGPGDLYFFVRSDEDTTLLINRPDATWICDDDSLGDSNPSVTIRDAASGLYNIWVGTYSDSGLVSATLYISGKAAK